MMPDDNHDDMSKRGDEIGFIFMSDGDRTLNLHDNDLLIPSPRADVEEHVRAILSAPHRERDCPP